MKNRWFKRYCDKCNELFRKTGKHDKICSKCWKKMLSKNGKERYETKKSD